MDPVVAEAVSRRPLRGSECHLWRIKRHWGKVHLPVFRFPLAVKTRQTPHFIPHLSPKLYNFKN